MRRPENVQRKLGGVRCRSRAKYIDYERFQQRRFLLAQGFEDGLCGIDETGGHVLKGDGLDSPNLVKDRS